MAYRSTLIGSRLFAVMFSEPENKDPDEILREVQAAYQKQGCELCYIAIVPTGMKAPGEEARKAMIANFGEMAKVCSSIHVVLRGSGIKMAAFRSILASMFLVGNRRMHVHEKVEEAFDRAGFDPAEQQELIRSLTALGFLT